MAIQRLRQLVENELDAVNEIITDKIHTHKGYIDNLAGHTIRSGGKRLRPLLVLLASHACGYKGDKHIKLAAMVEFFHTATLLHDDVIDESSLRRGRETANKIWGDKISILVGDYLLSQYMFLMVEVGNLDIMHMLTNITTQIGCSELKQLENRRKHDLTEETYFDIIRGKTSILFAASASLGAYISEVDQSIRDDVFQYGLHLGNAFQLIDDALDYCADSTMIGKNVGDDLVDGVPTLPLIYACSQSTVEQQEQIRHILREGTLDNLPIALKAIEETNAIAYTKQVAAKEVDSAISALHRLPNTTYKDGLIELAQYAISRDH